MGATCAQLNRSISRQWLDLARYADTNGYEKDRERSIWPYRDWVIRALNDDMPFDQFTIEQIAGDLRTSVFVADEREGVEQIDFAEGLFVDREQDARNRRGFRLQEIAIP